MSTPVRVIRAPSPWRKFSDTVSSSSTLVVDTVPLADITRLIYEFNFSANTFSDVKSLKLTLHKVDGDLEDIISSRFGGPLNLEINANVSGSDVEIELVNNESFDIDVCFLKANL